MTQNDTSAGVRLTGAIYAAASSAAALCQGVEPAAWRGRGAADAWTAGGIAGHIVEFLPYWAEKFAEAVRQPGTTIGRDINAPERLGAVVDGESMAPDEAAAAIRQASVTALATLRSLPPTAWAAPVTTLRFGTVSLEECVRRILLEHLEEHVAQIRQALAAESAP